MDDVACDTSACDSDPTTPQLSPTKSTSTYGWTSPRTPCSPRKVRSCLLFRDLGTESPLSTPLSSPTKDSLVGRLGAYRPLEISSLGVKYETLPQKGSLSTKYESGPLDYSPIRRLNPTTRFNHRSAPDTGFSPVQEYAIPADALSPGGTDQKSNSSSTSRPDDHISSTLSRPVEEVPCDGGSQGSNSRDHSYPGDLLRGAKHFNSDISLGRLSRLPVRFSSSPLRPSQWSTRGGFLSTPRPLSRTQDRFVTSRRPPNITRESFELNKPVSQLTTEERITRGASDSTDAFSRRLHRSGRMNEELRSLRETHSVLTSRSHMNRRDANLSIRRSSFNRGMRQVSNGAVWNVGGSSATSDTVIGVSDGRGGMLGTGTNAPLYTSVFLSRSDPEAELETYERRLALAFDVDQADRVLGHPSTPPGSPTMVKPSETTFNTGSPTKHVWKDSAWSREGALTRLFLSPESDRSMDH
jgi:hypothetical protein